MEEMRNKCTILVGRDRLHNIGTNIGIILR
jgi:hypothetical protein